MYIDVLCPRNTQEYPSPPAAGMTATRICMLETCKMGIPIKSLIRAFALTAICLGICIAEEERKAQELAAALKDANLAGQGAELAKVRVRQPDKYEKEVLHRRELWMKAVDYLLDKKVLVPGMAKAKLLEILGPPTGGGVGTFNRVKYSFWYFDTGHQVIPRLHCIYDGETVKCISKSW